MIKDLDIQGIIIKVNKGLTEQFYLSQENINSCPCEDCLYYATVLTNQPFEIFELLKEMRVDLKKNLVSEPTGVWCIRDDKERFVYFMQTYQVMGKIIAAKQEINYEKKEGEIKLSAKIFQSKPNCIDVELTGEKVS
jgi:hypothetical protein